MTIYEIKRHIPELDLMKKYPKELFAIGDASLLDRPKVSIVGTRRPSPYTKQLTSLLSQSLAKRGVCIVSGAAMGLDAIAHTAAGADNTIAVVANSLDIRYPIINHQMIQKIEEEGLVLSQFPSRFKARTWSFVVRNELVVALGDVLIVAEADENSGSMRSVEFALKMGKKVYVLPQRIGESKGTNKLLEEGLAEPIYNIEMFSNNYGIEPSCETIVKDDFFYFCQTLPTLDDAVEKFDNRVYEAELEGLISIKNGLIHLL